MNAATQSAAAAGPLHWVRREIDRALESADQALQSCRSDAAAADLARIGDGRTHLHQVRGALTVLGLDGVSQFAAALESLLAAIEQRTCPADEARIALAQRALASLRHYLDELAGGQPDQPLRLLARYREVQAARGEERNSPGDLFFPDLAVAPPPRTGAPAPLAPDEAQRLLRQDRSRFQRGMLTWLRDPQGGIGAGEMLGAVRSIEAAQESAPQRTFWWVASAFLCALAEGSLGTPADAKPLCARIDQQIRRRLEGAQALDERLLRDALYLLAQADSSDATVQQVSAAYRLPAAIAGAASEEHADRPAQDAPLHRLRMVIAAAETQWNAFCAGSAPALPRFVKNAVALSAGAEQLGQTDYRRLAQAIASAARWLAEQPARHSETLAMEIATAILLAQNAQENFHGIGVDFAHQVDVMVARIHGCIAENPPQPGSEVPALDEMSRQVQERRLIAQVAGEIHSNLAQIEQGLDAFFRDASLRAALPDLAPLLQQAVGALGMIGQGAAADALRACAERIGDFARADSDAQEADFERLAESLALLGFFVDALHYDSGDFTGFARSMQPVPKAAPTAAPTVLPAAPAPAAAELLPPAENPDVAGPEVVAEAPPPPKPPAPPPPAPPVAPQAAPPPEPPAPASEPAAPIDTELLAIFLEEAHDVLDTIGEQLQHLGEQPHDAALLTTLRRAFHTLKGSGRMVGLKELGSAAAAVEQVLNRWLDLSLDVNTPLSGLLGQAHAIFSAWVAFLEEQGKTCPDAGPLLALAESLEHGDADTVAGQEADEEASEKTDETTAATAAEVVAETVAEAGEAEVTPAGARIIEFKPPATAATPRITISPTLRDIFLSEAREHLATLNGAFGQPASAFGTPTPQAAPRAAHTLAGSAGTIGLDTINRCALALEHALLRRDRASDSDEALEIVAQSLAGLGAMLDAVAAGRDPEAVAGLIDALEQLYPATPAALPAAEAPSPAAAPQTPTPAAPTFDEIDEQLLPVFLEEVLDLSEGIAAQLRAWRADPADAGIARTLARLLHTLKGSARMVGAMSLGEIVHAIETRIGVAQETGSAPLELIDEIDAAYDALLEMIDRLQSGEVPPAESAALAPPVADTLTSAAAGQPPAEAASEPPAEAGVQHPLLRVRADLVDRLVGESGELSVARARIESEMRALKDSLLDLSENVIRLRHQLRDIEIQAESRIQSRTFDADERRDDFDPLEIDRFTHFQELTRMMAESVNDVATVQQNLLGNLDTANAALLAQARLNRQLQQDLMSIRTLPFDSVADRLYRIVRQTGKELGKRANLEIHGGQIELDRSVLERLAAPLEHLLRNAIAHGLEERETRIAHGKPEIGEISLTLAREGNEIVLTFADDGAGLDLERIRSRAIAAGLLAADETADTARIIDLIFAPGLSTAAGLSQLAGRGVGMDVVKNEVSRLGGRIEVATVPGKGTTFSLYIPLTLAVTQALLVRAGSQTYAIASLMIEQVLDLKDAALATIRDAGMAGWLGQQYPFAYLPQLLGDPQAVPEIRRKYQVLLLRSGNQRIAVQVDELQGKQEIVVKNVGEQLARVAGIDGATVLGNGQVVLILNPLALNSRSPAAAGAAGAAPVLAVPAAAAGRMAAALPTVMVVDDSLTVRKITGRLLSREGYEVVTAKDGVDALEKLLDVLPDLLLVDIEMPRMDGFDLTRNVRADPRLKEIPIIMITSRTADRHRNHALEIGVNQYLGKPYQEDELLRLVAGYVKRRT